MPQNFWDTSALAKLYLPERGSAWATQAADAGIAISKLSLAELAHVFSRKHKDGHLTWSQRDDLFQRFLDDATHFEFIEIADAILHEAAALLFREFSTRVRSQDAIQLASAHRWLEAAAANSIDIGVFVVADGPLRTMAEELGLSVDNPEEHE